MQDSGLLKRIKNAQLDIQEGRFEQAARSLIPLVEANPDNFEARHHLTQAYYGLGYFEEAVETFRPNFDKTPEAVDKYTYFGNLCLAAGLSEEAAAYFNKADQMQPDNPHIKSALGQCYVPLGDFETAKKYLKAALSVDPEHISSLVVMVDVAPDTLTDAQRHFLRAVLQDESRHMGTRVDAGFALGALLKRDGEYEEAFSVFERSNALAEKIFSQGGITFDAEVEKKQFETITGFFTPKLLEEIRSEADYQAPFTPVFILGLPRSGTTLIEQILASHSQVYAGGEQKTLGELYLKMEHLAGPGADDSKIDALKRLKGPWVEEYFSRMGVSGKSQYTHTTDKMPSNFPYAGAAYCALPNAKFVILRRDPLDTCLSMYFKPLTASYPASVSLSKLGDYHKLFECYAAYWERNLNVFTLSYEELVKNQKSVTERLLDYLDLPWDEACLKYYENRAAVKTLSSVQVREPISDKYVGHWKHYEKHLSPLLQALGMEAKKVS